MKTLRNLTTAIVVALLAAPAFSQGTIGAPFSQDTIGPFPSHCVGTKFVAACFLVAFYNTKAEEAEASSGHQLLALRGAFLSGDTMFVLMSFDATRKRMAQGFLNVGDLGERSVRDVFEEIEAAALYRMRTYACEKTMNLHYQSGGKLVARMSFADGEIFVEKTFTSCD